MYFKQKLAYMALGGLFTISGFLLATIMGDVGAQDQHTSVEDEVVCRRLKIVDSEGKTGVRLLIDEYGGVVAVHDKDGKGQAQLAIGEYGGVVSAHNKDGNSQAQLAIDKYGGVMSIFNKGNGNAVQAGVSDTGEGVIKTMDKLGYNTASLPYVE